MRLFFAAAGHARSRGDVQAPRERRARTASSSFGGAGGKKRKRNGTKRGTTPRRGGARGRTRRSARSLTPAAGASRGAGDDLEPEEQRPRPGAPVRQAAGRGRGGRGMALARPRSRGGARDSKGKAALPVPAGGHARDVPRAALRGGDDHRAFRAFVVVRHRRRRLEPDADSVRVFPVAHVFPSGRGRRRGLRFLRDAPGGERRFPVLRRAGRGRDARRARGVSRRAMGAVFGVVGHGRVRVRGRRPVRVGGRPNPPRARERRDPPPVGRAHDPVHLGQARGYRSRPPPRSTRRARRGGQTAVCP